MFSAVRRRFTYANVAMTLALVFAMTGGAYAAKHYLITSTKQISPKVLKQLKGKAGPAGPAGVAGVAGAQGLAGPAGKDGAAGSNGKDGATGLTGHEGPAGPKGATGATGATGAVGATGTTGAAGPQGPQGLQGLQGPQGSQGATGPAGPTGATGPQGPLQPNVSEGGTWAATQEISKTAFAVVRVPISFPIPLAGQLGENNVHFINAHESAPSGCSGNVEKPVAESGNLCVFAAEPLVDLQSFGFSDFEKESESGAGKLGTMMIFGHLSTATTEYAEGYGDWVVTG